MRRIGIIVAAIALLGLIAGVTLVSASPDITSPKTLSFIEKDTQFHVVDVPPANTGFTFSLGDNFTFSGKLLKGGKKVGHAGGRCTAVHVGPIYFECEATYRLPAGEVTAQALFHIENGPQAFNVAVNGGTGTYRNARGFIHIQDISQNASRDTFHLIP